MDLVRRLEGNVIRIPDIDVRDDRHAARIFVSENLMAACCPAPG
jgi:hypothetical protein